MNEKRWIDDIEQRTQRQEHNRDDVPALLGYARELERENERLKEQLQEAGRGGLGAHLAHLTHLEETTDWQAVQREIEENDRKLRESEAEAEAKASLKPGEACRLPGEAGEKRPQEQQ